MKKELTAEQLVNLVDKKHQDGLNYMREKQYLTKWPKYERFKAGDQWPAPTDRTKHMPRPVFNIIEYIQNHKVSSVVNENIKMVFKPEELIGDMPVNDPLKQQELERIKQAGDKFSRYSETLWEEIEQDELNEEALESAANIGTGIWHYFWDVEHKGGNVLPYIGKLCGETLDAINVFFDNPQQRDVQKQPGITITSREMVKDVRELARRNGLSKEMAELIKPDKDTADEGYDQAQVETDGSEKVTVKTRYWREDGIVHFCKVASSQMVKPKTSTGMKLYPLAVLQWKRRKKSIHGVGDTEGIIPNQVGVNFLMAMMLLSVRGHGWPKQVVNPQYVDPNSLNNDPSVPIISTAPAGIKAIEYLTPGPVSGLAADLVERFMEHTKTLSSAQDASTGEVGGGDLNATAIMLLQKAAGVPIESIKKRFYRAMKDVGRIWEEFYKVKYNTWRRVNVKDDDGNESSMEFRGSDFADVGLNLTVDIGPSSQYSEQLMMSTLDKLYDKGEISTVQYLKLVPKSVAPFRDTLIKELEEQEELMQAQPQPDPAALEAQRFQQQVAMKQMDHANQRELKAMDIQAKQAGSPAR